MYCKKYNIILFIIYVLIKQIKNFYVLPFHTVLINDGLLKENIDLYDYLFQSELYTNLTIGSPPQIVKSLIKFESNGFYIYQGAFNYTLSSSSKKYYWQIDKWFFNSVSYMITDHFYFNLYNTFNNFNNKNIKDNKIKTNETLFIIISKIKENINKNYINYGIIGLAYNDKKSLESPESGINFINICKNNWNLKNKVFYVDFDKDNYTYNKFFNNYHKGYLILGRDLTEDEKEKNKIKYTYLIKDRDTSNWIINFDQIYSKTNSDNNIKINFKQLGAQIGVNMPYLIGTNEYLNYINVTFFSELINQKLCFVRMINDTETKNDLFSFVCNGKSDVFKNVLNNNFSELVFESKDLEKNFSLNKYDLFSYNNFDKSDTNLYFLVLFNHNQKTQNKNWILGVLFFKKYIISFDYENKRVGYYLSKEIQMLEQKESKYIGIIFKIIGIIILISIIFILGMKYQKNKIKIPRKNKANELDDDYEYSSYENNNIIDNDKDINKKDNNSNKNVELGIKLFND